MKKFKLTNLFSKRLFRSAFLGLILVAVLGLGRSFVYAALNIVATTPDVADLAQQIGGSWVRVETLAKGTEDMHAIPMRPSFVPKLARAHAIVHIGLGAEHSFLPGLLEAASNPALYPQAKGDIDCSIYVTAREVPHSVSRDKGELHPSGNPHYNIDPRNGVLMSKAIMEGFSRLDPVHADEFKKNKESFDQALSAKLAEWSQAATRLNGVKVVSYHRDMVYLADFLGMQLVSEIEPKPGIAPSPKYLEQLAQSMRDRGVKLILNEVQYSDRQAKWLAEQTGASIAIVATMGGAFPGSNSYIGMIDHNINAILQAK